jgi:hypothetical protein
VIGATDTRGNWARRPWRCLALLCAVFGLISGSALGSGRLAPDRHGVIHACYSGNDENELHLIAPRRRCPSEDWSLSWSQRGPPGGRGEAGAFASSLLELSFQHKEPHKSGSVWEWIDNAVSPAENVFSLLGLGMLALALALSLLRWLTGIPWRWRWVRRCRWLRRLGKLFGPALQIEAFEDGAMGARVGPNFALLVQARIDGGRETGSHLYLVTGEERTGDYLAALQGVPQTQALAAALTLLRLLWRRPRLAVSGSLKPIDDRQTAAATLSLRLDARLIDTSEFWLSEPPTPTLTAPASNRVLAVAAAGWIEHEVIDETPGPPAREVLLSHDSRSWALFRAGSELNRMSLLQEAADLYERALAIDHGNIGALIDLAHLRRLDGSYKGAEVLALCAIELIEERNRTYRKWRDDEDPNWYRAQIVLATTYSDWARNSTPQNKAPDDATTRALSSAVGIAVAAMIAKDRLEGLLDAETLRDGAGQGKVGAWAYAKGVALVSCRTLWRKTKSALSRAAPLAGEASSAPPEDQPRGRWAKALSRARQLLAAARGRVAAAPAALRRRRTFRQRAVELHTLLETTFEPGALLLVASNFTAPNRATVAPVPRPPSSDRHRESLRRQRERLREERETVREQLRTEPLDDHLEPAILIDYVRDLPFKSPRVVYNLSCWFGREAASGGHLEGEVGYQAEALELLRESISRTPPLERRSLLSYAELDSDLEELRHAYGAKIAKLWRLVPSDDARFRELDQFTQDAPAWANRMERMRGLAVVGSWAQGSGPVNAVVEVLLIATEPDEFIGSDDWLTIFDRPAVLRRWQTQALYRLRVELPSGLTLEFLIARPPGAQPLDPALRKLAGEGFSVLYDEDDVLRRLLDAAAKEAHAASAAKKAHAASRPSCAEEKEI